MGAARVGTRGGGWMGERCAAAGGVVGPSAALRFAQDDRLFKVRTTLMMTDVEVRALALDDRLLRGG